LSLLSPIKNNKENLFGVSSSPTFNILFFLLELSFFKHFL
jgi:hypothetical protein